MSETIDWDNPIGLWWRKSRTDVSTEYVGTLSKKLHYPHVVKTKDDLIAVNDCGAIFGYPEHTIRNVREPGYRPYTPDELAALVGTAVRRKSESDTELIVWHGGGGMTVWAAYRDSIEVITSHRLLHDYTHLDGTPCGVLTEDDE